MRWYALFVKSGKEEEVCGYLRRLLGYYTNIGVRLLVPKRKLGEYHAGERKCVERIIFPGYILVYTKDIENFFRILKIGYNQNIYTVLKTDRIFQEVNEAEISVILKLINSSGIIEKSKIFVQDKKVKVVEGPLARYSGTIKKINSRKGRAKIEIKFLGRVGYMDIEVECLELDENQTIRNIIDFSV